MPNSVKPTAIASAACRKPFLTTLVIYNSPKTRTSRTGRDATIAVRRDRLLQQYFDCSPHPITESIQPLEKLSGRATRSYRRGPGVAAPALQPWTWQVVT